MKASSGELFAPHNFVLLVTLQGTHVHLTVYLCAPNEIGYGKIGYGQTK